LINSVKQLLELGKGDPGRLEYILEMLTQSRMLPFSDQKYLENMIALNLRTNDSEIKQKENQYTIDQLQSQVQTINERLAKLERGGFERYIGKKTVFFFVTVFVGWNALQTYTATFLNMFLPADMTQYFYPLNLVARYSDYSVIQFVFTSMMYAWLFIGFKYLIRFIRYRKITER